jgi:hypothetical protein
MDKIDAVFFCQNLWIVFFLLSLHRLYKRKQALLGSNLSGILQMTDENVNAMGFAMCKAHCYF